MAAISRTALKSSINSDLPTNTTQAISALDVRSNMIDLADSLVFNNGETAQDIEGSVRTRRPVVAVSATTKTLSLSDANVAQHCSNVAAQTLTIPTNAVASFSVGDRVPVRQLGNGAVTVQGASGVSINGVSAGSVAVSAQFAEIVAENVGIDAWVVG